MKINEVLLLKYPNVDFMKDIILQDEGEGPYIKEWNVLLLGERPTQDQISQWSIELEPEYVISQNKIKNQPIFDQLKEIDVKSIRALRSNDTQRLSELETAAQELRNQLL